MNVWFFADGSQVSEKSEIRQEAQQGWWGRWIRVRWRWVDKAFSFDLALSSCNGVCFPSVMEIMLLHIFEKRYFFWVSFSEIWIMNTFFPMEAMSLDTEIHHVYLANWLVWAFPSCFVLRFYHHNRIVFHLRGIGSFESSLILNVSGRYNAWQGASLCVSIILC